MTSRITTAGRRLIGAMFAPPVRRIDSTGIFQFGESNLVDQPSTPDAGAGGKNGKERPPPAAGTIIKAQVAERWIQQVTAGLTPEDLSGFLTQAVMGDTWNYFALFDEMEEKWPEYRIALFKHKLKSSRRNPRIVPPDHPQDAALAKEKADFANYVFAGIADWHRTAFNLLDAVAKGVSAAEIDWQIGEVQGKQAVIIRKMPWVLHRHLSWWWDVPEIQLFPDLRNRALHFDVPDRKFVIFHHLSKSGHPSRAAMGRPLAWYFLIYLYAMKDWSTLAETYGIDVAHAFCNKDATQEQRNAILLHLSRLAARAGVFDEGTVINIARAATSGNAPQEALVRYCCEKAIQGLLGSTLGTEAGEKGARSLGLVQQDETEELIDWTCLLFGGTITNTALRWLMDFNFAEPGDNPVMELPGANRRDLAALANVVNILARVQLPIPVDWVRSQFDIPAPKIMADGSTEPVLVPLPGTAPTDKGDPGQTQTEGEALTGKDQPPEGIVGYSTLTEHKFQAALDEIRRRALLEGRDVGAFEQMAGPIKKIVFGEGTPEEKMAQLQRAAQDIEPTKLEGVAREIILLADLASRAAALEHTTGINRGH